MALAMKAIFLSDVHLRDSKGVKAQLVIRFFQEVASKFETIYVLGDLFDVWPGTTGYLVKEFKPVIQTLRQLVNDGHQLHYIEGNHDFHLGEYFSESLGILVHPNSNEENWDGLKVYMAHGDLGNPRDYGYRALRFLLRRETTHHLIRAVPPDLVFDLGLRTSSLSRSYQSNKGNKDTLIRQTYRQTAEEIFKKGFDVVLMGHTHLPDDVTTLVNGRRCRYINTGDWVKHFTYLEFDGAQFYTRTHPVKNL